MGACLSPAGPAFPRWRPAARRAMEGGVHWRMFIFALGIASVADGAAARAEGWPLRGEIQGELKLDALADLGLKWELQAVTEGVLLRASRPGLKLEVAGRPGPDGGWAWELRPGTADLAELWPLLRPLAGEEAAGWSASGRIEFAGEGAWSAAAGPTGELRVSLREGWARSDELELELNGIELDLKGNDLAKGALAAGQELRVAKVSKAGVEVRDVRVRFGLSAAQVVEVSGGEASLFGGWVRLKPFAVPLAVPAVNAAAEVEALQLGEVANLLPWLVQQAKGRLRGRVELSWDTVKGLRVRDGGLAIVKSDDAAFRLAPSPGLLTGTMPDMLFSLAPSSVGWMHRIGLSNPAYAPMKDIEMGRDGLRIETFQVTFWPDGPSQGRTATIHIVGRPDSGKLVKEVVMDVNFNGPWSEFLTFGLNQDFDRLSFRLE